MSSISRVTGNTQGLKASTLRAAERIYRRRVPPTQLLTPELADLMCQVSRDSGRQVGVLLDRRGRPEHVFLGDANRLFLPDVGRLRAARGRLRGLRLVHTHLRNEGLTRDDLTDLALLRLDFVAAVTMTNDGRAHQVHCAHLVPGVINGTPWTLLDAKPVRAFDLDPAAMVAALEAEFARQSDARMAAAGDAEERAVLVHLATPGSKRSSEVCIAELKELCRTARVDVVDQVVQRRNRPDPRYVIGRGKVDDVVLRANQLDAGLLIFDPDLLPAQARAISDATDLKIIDRSMLILDIFARHAQTSAAKLQVELAQLRYALPRLIAKNTMMSRLTGGIGGRGPGETKLEIGRRRARDRIALVSRKLDVMAQQREQRRALRKRKALPAISIVGYTNAGKSTLLNTITQGDALVADKLFATLNPLGRRLRFPREREVIISDTVGFIHDLPDELVQAFRATLEELREADLLVHVVDISDAEYEAHIAAVQGILADLEVTETPMLLVLNKLDKLEDELADERLAAFPGAIGVCALKIETTRPLIDAMAKRFWPEERTP